MGNISAALLAELRRNGRASISELAATLKVSRATIKTHLDRMTSDGTITGFTVVTDQEPKAAAVTGLITIALEGGAINRIVSQLRHAPEITTIRSTNGVWDIVVEFGVGDVAALDDLLMQIRDMSGVTRSETSIYLRHRHG
ncbi:MAG: Lrp/AsnC family transcriptional regulator [Pikeienuella sp.]